MPGRCQLPGSVTLGGNPEREGQGTLVWKKGTNGSCGYSQDRLYPKLHAAKEYVRSGSLAEDIC